MDGPIIRLPSADIPRLQQLLRQNNLPAEDCVEQAEHFYGLYRQQDLVAAGGLEPAGTDALLRSIVVHPDYRSQALGRMMTEFLLQRAVTQAYKALYLLTENADEYFHRFGFSEIQREQVPAGIAATQQFSTLCPDTATCMWLDLVSGRN